MSSGVAYPKRCSWLSIASCTMRSIAMRAMRRSVGYPIVNCGFEGLTDVLSGTLGERGVG